MKKLYHKVKLFCIRTIALWVLMIFREITLRDKISLGKIYEIAGFNSVLWYHPSLLFSVPSGPNNKLCRSFVLVLFAKIIRKAIHAGALYHPKAKMNMQRMNILRFFYDDVYKLLDGESRRYVPYIVPENVNKKNKIAVYSVITGDYDCVNELLYQADNVDYYLFTNNETIKSKTWNIRFIHSDHSDVVLSREVKMFPEKFLPAGYEASVYVDANAVIFGDISLLTCLLNNNISFVVTKHECRNTVYDEILACIERKHIDKQQAFLQYEKYCKDGFKDNMGLAECTILVRRHGDESLTQLMSAWFDDFVTYVHRDQLSLLPCVHRLNFTGINLIDGCVWNNQFCINCGLHS